MRGWQDALLAAGLGLNEELVVHAEGFSWDHGQAAAEAVLSLPGRPTAIMAMNDPLAIGLYRGCRLRGLDVPDDISLMGYSGLPEAALLDTPLSTVRQPVEQLGSRAAEMIVAMTEDRENKDRVELLDDELLLRESCCPPR
jgi:DNA-binding LacI/PurR family transcriptional regulator